MSRKTERDGTQLGRLGGLLLAMAVLPACGGGSGPPAPTNHAPVTAPSAASLSLVMSQSTDLSAHASDEDGDTLTYSWAQTAPASPQGTFSAQTSSSTSWTAPTVGSTTLFTLSVTVSDGRGGTGSGNVKVYAKTSADPSLIADVQPILSNKCTGCHSPPCTGACLNLVSGSSYAALVGAHALLNCTSQLYVKPGDPDNSVLFEKMSGTACGVRMPPDDTAYFDRHPDELNLVRTWILQGAANN